MISQLKGVLSEKTPTRIVLDVNGVGYEVLVPITTFEKLEQVGKSAKLLTYLHVREDALQLFGFFTEREKWLFSNLISVSGVGPKLALAILSGSSSEELTGLIVNGDVDALTRLPGVGRKTAQRLVTELKDKFGEMGLEAEITAVTPQLTEKAAVNNKLEEASLALVALGYNRANAQKLIVSILNKEPDLPIDELIKKVLQSN
ncbi:Holliday junction branch migration protein RuvA [candidate division KSB1 bacterium]|nr:Holliday junction branch migration protein RuvA [candidate division KSB1 bacterium]NIR70261.1 Holliday junction branch migration protein RuvA [candidate division KSB1 bacterium]NIS26532.1 Holliday junction branch migration protein RuvA [candidate division KSB1 bacterium]NIT73294.1 Holliday junction branch migration protein RuvA [candidate division KSB1 bacterium]NIU23918.1 Holliday junction branch migration protein RuvA [candidate division KSB1 bacterium]